MEAFLRTQTKYLLQNILQEQVILGIKGKNRIVVFFHKSDKIQEGKLHHYETEIDAQACNVSYRLQIACCYVYLSHNIYIQCEMNLFIYLFKRIQATKSGSLTKGGPLTHQHMLSVEINHHYFLLLSLYSSKSSLSSSLSYIP